MAAAKRGVLGLGGGETKKQTVATKAKRAAKAAASSNAAARAKTKAKQAASSATKKAAPKAAGPARPKAKAKAKAASIEYRILLTATMCLLAYGAVMVYSASSVRDVLQGGGNGSAYLAKYVGYGLVGLLAMHVIRGMPLESVRKGTPLLLAVAFGLTFAVQVPGVGVEVNGAKRWIGAGPLQFQPSELLKLALVLYAVNLLAARPKHFRTLKGILNPLGIVAGAAALLVATQPDLGTALIISFTLGCLLVAAGVPIRNLAIIAAVAAFLIIVFALMEPYRRARLTSFLNPWADASGSGFQSVQGQIALGSGGLFGVGLGQSVQKVFYLPEAHTDFILAVIGEELGAAGVMGLLFLYGMIGYAGLRTAKTARGAYAKLLATGVTSLILCQALLNMFTVLGLAPLTGVPLPFISYGSSSLMVMLASMGLLLNIASGSSVKLRAVREPKTSRRNADTRTDRSRRNSRARGARAGGRRRATG